MTFIETRFPADISYGSAGGPEYSTDIVITQGGHEQRNSNWLDARARYNVAYGVRTQTQLDELIRFFRVRRGRADGFRFKDWSDYSATAQALGTGDAEIVSFQLQKHYESGSQTQTRFITKPVVDTVVVYADDVEQDSETYSVNDTTGIVTFDTPPANGVVIAADFEFDVPVRFDTDRLSAVLESYGIASINDIPLIEVRG